MLFEGSLGTSVLSDWPRLAPRTELSISYVTNEARACHQIAFSRAFVTSSTSATYLPATPASHFVEKQQGMSKKVENLRFDAFYFFTIYCVKTCEKNALYGKIKPQNGSEARNFFA